MTNSWSRISRSDAECVGTRDPVRASWCQIIRKRCDLSGFKEHYITLESGREEEEEEDEG